MIKQPKILNATLTFWRLFNKAPSPKLFTFLTEQPPPAATYANSPAHKLNQKLIDQYLPYLRFIPGVQAVAVCNSHSLETDNNTSDIDLFIVLKKQLFFTGRLLISLYFQLLKLRRHDEYVKNRFCLSFFISDDHLNLKSILLNHDIYFYFWFRTLQWYIIPESFSNWQQKWWNKNHSWLKFKPKQLFMKPTWQKRSKPSPLLQKLLELTEPINKKLQLKRAQSKNIELGEPRGVIIKPGLLKFHVVDKRPEINKKFWTSFQN